MNPENILKLLNLCHDDIADSILELSIPEHPINMLKIALTLSLIEALGSMLTLVETKRYIGITIIFRTFLESYVELKNLVKDDNYYNQAMFQYFKDEVQRFESSSKGNRFLKSLKTFDDFEARLDKSKKAKKNLADKGYKGISIKAKFEIIGMEDEYNSIYKFLCSDAHSDLRSLNSRHFEANDTGKTVLVLYKDINLERFLPELDSAATLLLDAASIILREFKSDRIDHIIDLQKQHKALISES